MAFGGLIQTTLGRNLSTRSKLGTPMTFTHIAIGDGHYSGSYNDITHLTNSLFTLPAAVTMVGDNALLEVDLNNSGITTGYYFREIGVYASDGTNSVLYAYDNAGNDAQLIQSGGGAVSIAKRIRLVLTELADANVVIDNVDALYVTFEELVQNLSGYATEEELAALERDKVDIGEIILDGADLNDYLVDNGFFYTYSNVDVCAVANVPTELTHSFSLHVRRGWGDRDGACVYNQTLQSHALKSILIPNIWIRSIVTYEDRETYYAPWRKLAIADPPQEFDLPLAAGWSSRGVSRYSKTQDSVVMVDMSLESSITTTYNTLIATLPYGYRPTKSLDIPVMARFTDYSIAHGHIAITTDGAITVYHAVSATHTILEFIVPPIIFVAQ